MVAALTDGEKRVLGMAWHCFTAQPKVDYKKLAELGGYKNEASAAAIFSAAKRKLMADASSSGGTTAPLTKAAAATGGRGGKKRSAKAMAAQDPDDNDNNNNNDTSPPPPAAPRKKRGRPSVTVPSVEQPDAKSDGLDSDSADPVLKIKQEDGLESGADLPA